MTGNIIGEGFSEKLKREITRRQKVHGSGFSSKRSINQIQYLNNRNAWLKMASSVYVVGDQTNRDFRYDGENESGGLISADTNRDGIFDGVERLKAIGISDPQNFVGNQLAEKTVLFNTLQGAQFNSDGTFKSYKTRSGVSKSNSLWNGNNSYGLGGTDYGLSPAPGLLGADIKCINRGSIREAKVTIKAYNKFQFELLELVYLRLGYSVMLEWGFDKYIDENQQIQNVGNTLIENDWFKNQVSNIAMYSQIEYYRGIYNFHYDAFYGKVVNFDWEFNSDGTYNITLKLITRGDVIESLTARNKVLSITPEDIEDDINRQSGFFTRDTGVGKIPESTIVGVAGDSKLGLTLYELVRDKAWAERIEGDTVRGNFFSWENSREHYDQNYPNIDLPDYNYFMTFGKLLEYCETKLQPIIAKPTPEPAALLFKRRENEMLCSTYPNIISLDPKVCLIKPQIYQTADNNIVELEYPDYLRDLKEFTHNDGDVYYGKLMNIYINFEFIAECLQGVDDEGELSIFGFLEQITTGINKSLGNVVNLEAVITEDVIVTIIDQNAIPGLVKPPEPTINLYGSLISGSNSTSNFVTDVNFKTEITPDLATQITIGATAGGNATKNYDATAFSNWNKGLIDRQNPSFIDTPGIDETNEGTEEQDAAWDAGTPVGDFTKKINIRISGNEDQESAYEENKNVTYKGIRLPNVEYSTFLTIANGIDYGQRVIKSLLTPITRGLSLLDSIFYNVEKQYSTNFQLYIVRAFGGKANVETDNGNTKLIKVKTKNALYTQLSDDFVSQGHQSFKGYVNLNNQKLFKERGQPSSQIGFLPLKLGFTTEGISGVKIYNGFKSQTSFLPYQYDKAVRFIIDQVDHKIENNNWTTNLGCLSVPLFDENSVSPFENKQQVASDADGNPQLLVDRGPNNASGPLDRDGILTDDPLKIIDKRAVNGVPVNPSTYRKEISIDTAVSYINIHAQNQFRQFYNNLKNEGYDSYVIKINAVYRSFQRSVELKEQNPKNASPGKSVHNYAAGVDFNVIDSYGRQLMKADYDPWIEQGIVAQAEKVGIKWGGYFAGYRDSVHFYVDFNRNTALQNAAADNPGIPQRDWDTRNTELN